MYHRSIARMFLALVAGLTIGSSAAQQASVSAVLPPLPMPIPALARWEMAIDGVAVASFTDLVVISSVAAPLPEGPVGVSALVIPPHVCTVALRRQLTRNIEISSWHELVVFGDPGMRKSFSLTGHDALGRPQVRYYVTDGYPIKHEIDGLRAGASEVPYENVTFTCEFIQRVSL